MVSAAEGGRYITEYVRSKVGTKNLIMGDANCDGKVDGADKGFIWSYIWNAEEIRTDGKDYSTTMKIWKGMVQCDLNHDNVVDSADAEILNRIAK